MYQRSSRKLLFRRARNFKQPWSLQPAMWPRNAVSTSKKLLCITGSAAFQTLLTRSVISPRTKKPPSKSTSDLKGSSGSSLETSFVTRPNTSELLLRASSRKRTRLKSTWKSADQQTSHTSLIGSLITMALNASSKPKMATNTSRNLSCNERGPSFLLTS
jgi:hypothetical protein